MVYTIDVFYTLTEKYPSWDEFQTFITSAEGGSMRVVGEGRYRILRYVKGVSNVETPHGKWMRSLIWDTQQNLPVCVAPPKAEKGCVPTGEGISYPLVEDYLDGIMINVFRTVDDPNTLQIATRSQLGATSKFYSDKTFEEMFSEALVAMKLTRQDILDRLAQPTPMVPNHFISFLLQHPNHRVVARCRSPRLWIVQLGCVLDNGTISMSEDCETFPTRFHLPRHTAANICASQETLNAFFSETCTAVGWFYQGMTFKDDKGNRWRMRNPDYLYLRTLRGTEGDMVDRFIRLRSQNKVSEYLKHYSEDREKFWEFEETLRTKTRDVYTEYCAVHKAHEKKFEEVDASLKPCVFKLHAHYLGNLKPISEKVYMKDAVSIVNALQPFEQKRLLVTSSPLLAVASTLVASSLATSA